MAAVTWAWVVVTALVVIGVAWGAFWCWDEALTDREVRRRLAEADALYLERSRAHGPDAYRQARRDVDEP